ncbi:MAG: CsbD family protein [Marinobacter sp.]|uniref:CsbD family protein n=1 Tax=Marinobacter sp. TaxID=50741 RepID=UPI001B3D0820|nr:CsbD family protein [Marinobacter sp.]MBQ0745042.1 CsbD family protein [Marinobacter sp.]MBQ0816235.1 CsbD family protein [Marinobacter sp.]|tara:strand:- start:372 stop:572 length:201 start_codon:yes stop_codon:yes gene_type:complete
MNKDIADGKWQQMKGKIQQKWGDLTDDDLDRINGQREEFAGVMKERYGKSKEEAEQEFDKLRNSDI